MALVEIDGVTIDTETGEVIESPAEVKRDLRAWLQVQHREATEIQKGWEMQKGAVGRALMREMQAGGVSKVQSGDLVSSLRGGGSTRTFLRDKWREDMEAAELTLADWREIALNLLDTDTPPPGMTREEFERSYVQRKPRSKYIQTDPVLKMPRAKVVE